MQAMLTYLEATRFKILNVMMDLEGKQRVNHPMAAYLDHTKDKQGLYQSVLNIPSWITPETQPVPLDWEDRGTADGRVETWSPGHSPANRSPYLHTAIGICDDRSHVFTTMNPILYSPQAEDLLSRGRADGGLETDESILNSSRDDDTGTPLPDPEPDSDFDEFDSTEEDVSQDISPSSQDNEIHEIYYQEKQVAVIGQCRAVYDYTANIYDELSIKYGDIINIHDKQEDDWWLGECDGKVGIFPATYVEVI